MAKTPAADNDKLGYDYDRDTPPAAPAGAPPADAGPESMAAYPTTTLQTWRKELRTPSATDAGFLAAVAGALGMLLDRELTHPNRLKRDKAAEEQSRKALNQQRVDGINARYDAELASLGGKDAKDATPAQKAAVDDLEKRRKAEIDALDAAEKREELAKKQAEETAALQAKQAADAAKLNPAPAEAPKDAPKTGG